MSEYKHGEMNIRSHEKTFEGFVSLVTKLAIAAIVVLVFMALVNA